MKYEQVSKMSGNANIVYRRRDNTPQLPDDFDLGRAKQSELDNKWVVAYNPYLLMKLVLNNNKK